MSNRGKTLLAGHTLEYEGRGYYVSWCVDCAPGRVGGSTWHSTGGEGHGYCSCGAASDHLKSGNARRRWHKWHKEAIRLGLAGSP